MLEKDTRFGKLTIIGLDHIEHKKYNCKSKKCGYSTTNIQYYKCKCECGKECIVRKADLKSGNTKSCGCFQKSQVEKSNSSINGLYGTRIYHMYKNMLDRCFNPKNNHYKYYGEKGIKVCDEWKNDFLTFYNWAIKNEYNDNLTIDRINNNKNYCPENCRFVNYYTQANNKSNNHIINYNGVIDTMANISKKFNIGYSCLKHRVRKGLYAL